VTLPKIIIKIKKAKVKHSHSLPHLAKHYKNKGADLSSKIWRSQKLLYTLLIRVILRDLRIISEIPLTFRKNLFNIAQIDIRSDIEKERWQGKKGSRGSETSGLWHTSMRERLR
jgi:hypothetical protein